MAKQTIADGETGLSIRTKLNEMFAELYGGEGGYKEKLTRSSGTPSTGDPASLTTITHTFVNSYSSAPDVILVPKSDWHVYIVSVNTTTVIVGVGAYGSGSTLDYDLVVF